MIGSVKEERARRCADCTHKRTRLYKRALAGFYPAKFACTATKQNRIRERSECPYWEGEHIHE